MTEQRRRSGVWWTFNPLQLAYVDHGTYVFGWYWPEWAT